VGSAAIYIALRRSDDCGLRCVTQPKSLRRRARQRAQTSRCALDAQPLLIRRKTMRKAHQHTTNRLSDEDQLYVWCLLLQQKLVGDIGSEYALLVPDDQAVAEVNTGRILCLPHCH
jgi:hypothetical protein